MLGKIKLLCLLLPLAFAGCNSDIFVDPVDDVVESIFLSGDNGSAAFKIQRRGLESVEFDNNVDYDALATYYDKDGEIINNPHDIDRISRILYNSHTFAVEFDVQGDRVDISALDNANQKEIEVRVFLNYGYTTKAVTIHISEGRPLEIRHFVYDTSNPIVGIGEKRFRTRYINNSEKPLSTKLYPFSTFSSTIALTTDESWADGLSGTVSVPAFVDGEWSDKYQDEAQVIIGSTTPFFTAVAPEAEVNVDVPPFSTLLMEVTVTYVTLDTNFSGEIVLPNSELMWLIFGRWQQRQPIDFKIDSTIEE